LIDMETGVPRYAIVKTIGPKRPRFYAQAKREWTRRGNASLAATYFSSRAGSAAAEPFAMLHRDV